MNPSSRTLIQQKIIRSLLYGPVLRIQSKADTASALEKFKVQWMRDFPGGAVVKNPPANAGDMGSSPGPGRSHMPRNN